jgi:predicted transcriptional regulator
MECLQGLDKLFFELASESRLGILSELQVKELRMQELAKRLGLTDTEVSRQLQRLNDALLVQKQANGTYRMTAYAQLVLDIMSPLGVISKNREYFLEHDTSLLPFEFRARLGDLTNVKLTTSTVDTMNEVAEMFEGAQNKIDASVLGVKHLLEITLRRLHEGVKVRWLVQESFLNDARTMFRPGDIHPEIRSTPRIIGNVNVTDKVAMLTLRRHDGAMSYNSFYGGEASFMKWAEDLFTHEWEKAKPWYPYT